MISDNNDTPGPNVIYDYQNICTSIGAERRRRAQYIRNYRAFVKGPVPMVWIQQASMCGGSSLAVGMYLWFQAGISKSLNVRISQPVISKWLQIELRTVQRAMKALQSGGLIQIKRLPGQKLSVHLVKNRTVKSLKQSRVGNV